MQDGERQGCAVVCCSYLCGAQEHLTTRRYQLQRLKEGMEPLLQMPIRLLEGQH